MALKVQVIKDGKIVASSKNLEALGRYGRVLSHFVTKATASKLPKGKGLLKVRFANGAKAQVEFESYEVLKKWLATKKKRSGWA